MNQKIFVAGIGWEVTKDDLEAAFKEYGTIAFTKLIKDNRYKDPKRWFGFVEFEKEESAQAAVDDRRGKEAKGQQITVQFARERQGG